MKLVFVAFACLAIAAAVALPRRGIGAVFDDNLFSNINDDIKDFVNLVPLDEMIEMAHSKTDEEMRGDLEFAESKEAQQMGLDLENSLEFHKVIEAIEALGIGFNKTYWINYVHDKFKWDHVTRSNTARATGGSLRRFLMDEVKPMIPTTKLKLLAARKYIFSSAFRKLVKLALSSSFSNDCKALLANEQTATFEDAAREHGVDMDAISDFVKSLLKILYETFDERMLHE